MPDYVESLNYGSVNEYVKYIKETFEPSNGIGLGRFYCFNYKFALDYPYQELRLFDIFPMPFIFEKDEHYCTGLNLHHIPVEARDIWLDRVRKISKQVDSMVPYIDFGNPRLFRIPGLNYPLVYKLLVKTKVAIRRYRYDRMYDVRSIPLQSIWEMIYFHGKTYLNATIKDIEKRWLEYKPTR